MLNSKGFSKLPLIIGVLVVLIGAGVVWASMDNKTAQDAMSEESSMMENANSDEAMMEDKMEKDEPTMQKDDPSGDDAMMEKDDSAMMEKQGSYKTYSPETVEAEQKAGNKVVLFFHAPWCPFCKAADSAFNSRSGEIPDGVTVLKTDYDSNTELKQKYGVTYQHTFVQIDNNENQISKWNGGDIDNLKKYVK